MFKIVLIIFILFSGFYGFGQTRLDDKINNLWQQFFLTNRLDSMPSSIHQRDSVIHSSTLLHYNFIRFLSKNKFWSETVRQADFLIPKLLVGNLDTLIATRKLLSVSEIHLLEEMALWQKIQSDSLLKDVRNYLQIYPFGQYQDVLNDSILVFFELNLYRLIVAKESFQLCDKYFSQFPQGRYASRVDAHYNALKHKYFDDLTVNGDIEKLISFYNRFESDSLGRLIKNQLEDSVYAKIKVSVKMYYIDFYNQKFNNGKYTKEVDSLRQEYIFQEGVTDFKNKSYRYAKSTFINYSEQYPEGRHIHKAKKYVRKSDIYLNLLKNEYDHTYFVFGVDQEPSFNLSIGNLTNDFGYYFNFRAYKFNFDTLTLMPDGTHNSGYDYLERNGSIIKETVSITVGGSFNPFHSPVWIFGGLGLAQYAQSANYAGYSLINGQYKFQQSRFFTVQGPDIVLVPEIGVVFAIKKALIFRYGLTYNGSAFINQMGIGFAINNSAFDIGGGGNNDWLKWMFIGWGS